MQKRMQCKQLKNLIHKLFLWDIMVEKGKVENK